MIQAKEIRVSAREVRSLVWRGDMLVDWVGGGRQFTYDGEVGRARVNYAYAFDAAVGSISGEFSVIYARLGTKGLVLRRGEILREINRSFYQADAYEFPIALVRLETGHEVMVHCPDRYNQLEIDDIATGERLTISTSRKPSDCFHSRLAGSPDGTRIVSAGWLWHPIDEVRLFDVATALTNPCHLDGKGLGIDAWAEGGASAAFLPDGRLVVDLVDIETDDNAPGTSADELRIFSPGQPGTPEVIHRIERLGTMMAVGRHHLLGLYEHPKLVDLRTGEVVRNWTHIACGKQTSSIMLNNSPIPPIAIDASGQRCAIADSEGISVLQFLQ